MEAAGALPAAHVPNAVRDEQSPTGNKIQGYKFQNGHFQGVSELKSEPDRKLL